MRHAQRALLLLVERIFEDGTVTPEERSELVSLYSGGGLTVGEVKEVFRTFLRSTWGDVIADDVVTAAERKKLLAIVRELRLPDEQIPRDVRDALDRAA